MRRHQTARQGQGTAWLVADRLSDNVYCYWYMGTNDGRLVDHSMTVTANDAVAWGRSRTPRVRIRTRDGQSQWAGTEPRPATLTTSWSD